MYNSFTGIPILNIAHNKITFSKICVYFSYVKDIYSKMAIYKRAISTGLQLKKQFS